MQGTDAFRAAHHLLGELDERGGGHRSPPAADTTRTPA
jgi:hypothetical protein